MYEVSDCASPVEHEQSDLPVALQSRGVACMQQQTMTHMPAYCGETASSSTLPAMLGCKPAVRPCDEPEKTALVPKKGHQQTGLGHSRNLR